MWKVNFYFNRYLTKELYSEDVFPTFCHGALWMISFPLLNALYCVSEKTDYGGFFLEDVLITGFYNTVGYYVALGFIKKVFTVVLTLLSGILREKLGLGESYIQPTIDKRLHKNNDLMLFHLGSAKSSDSPLDELMLVLWSQMTGKPLPLM